jgi:hypothetical protein
VLVVVYVVVVARPSGPVTFVRLPFASYSKVVLYVLSLPSADRPSRIVSMTSLSGLGFRLVDVASG